MKKHLIYIIFILTLLEFTSCGIYSFSGADYGKAETVRIDFFDNVATIINPNLSQVFTEKLKDKFVSQTPLDLVNRNGDLHFEGKITGYDVKPLEIQAGETAASNRLTITIKVKFTNNTLHKNDYDRTFSWYSDFDSSKNLADVETELMEEITETIVDDVFNAAVVNW